MLWLTMAFEYLFKSVCRERLNLNYITCFSQSKFHDINNITICRAKFIFQSIVYLDIFPTH